jgi:hypothetical protein
MRKTVHRMPITKARINLGQVAWRAPGNREYFIVEKDGIPVAGVLNAEELEDYLELQEPGVKAQIRKSNAEYRGAEGATQENPWQNFGGPREDPKVRGTDGRCIPYYHYSGV